MIETNGEREREGNPCLQHDMMMMISKEKRIFLRKVSINIRNNLLWNVLGYRLLSWTYIDFNLIPCMKLTYLKNSINCKAFIRWALLCSYFSLIRSNGIFSVSCPVKIFSIRGRHLIGLYSLFHFAVSFFYLHFHTLKRQLFVEMRYL